MPEFNAQTFILPFTGLNATIAGLAFAAIVFVLRGSPSGDQPEGRERQERDQALAVLVVCVFAHLLTAGLAPAAAGSAGPTMQWIIIASIVPVFILGAAGLFMSIYLVLHANAATMPASLAGRIFDLVILQLTIFAFGFALTATAILGDWRVRPIDLPLRVISVYGLAAVASAAIASLLSTRRRVLEFATRSSSFVTLLTAEMLVIAGLITVASATAVIQPTSVNRGIWIAFSVAALAVLSMLLSLARLWLLHGSRPIEQTALHQRPPS